MCHDQGMSIQIGDSIPSVTLRTATAEGPKEINSTEFCAGRKVLLIGIVGAFTGTCANDHLPAILNNYDAFREKGIDEIAVTSTNDIFALDAFAKEAGTDGKITMLADGNAELAKGMDLFLDATGFGMGPRTHRYAMLLDDGKVSFLSVEENPGVCTVASNGASLLESL